MMANFVFMKGYKNEEKKLHMDNSSSGYINSY